MLFARDCNFYVYMFCDVFLLVRLFLANYWKLIKHLTEELTGKVVTESNPDFNSDI